MSQFTEKDAREFWIFKDDKWEKVWTKPTGNLLHTHVIEKSAYDRMKLALKKAIEQRNSKLFTDAQWEDGAGEKMDAEIQRILEGKE